MYDYKRKHKYDELIAKLKSGGPGALNQPQEVFVAEYEMEKAERESRFLLDPEVMALFRELKNSK
jgi:hypothetical protein